MNDLLLQLSHNPTARRLVSSLGLPVSLPAQLERASGPWQQRCLEGRSLVLCGAGDAPLLERLGRVCMEAGADIVVAGSDASLGALGDARLAWGREVTAAKIDAPPESARPHGLLVDASSLTAPAELSVLYDFLHAWTRSLGRSGRVLVVGRPGDSTHPAIAATQAALAGFVRSLAKELGRRGATANLIEVERGAEDRVGGPARFLLSPHSAFVTGQRLRVSALSRATEPASWAGALSGKVALVTGAARGIGEATAARLAAEGAHVICTDQPSQDAGLSQVAQRLRGSMLVLDVAAPDAAEALSRHLRERHGGVDILVHNAGVTRDRTLGRMSPDEWRLPLAINLEAPVRLTRGLLEAGLVRSGARVVCLASVVGISGNAGQSNYAASKAGLIGFVRSLAEELAPRGATANAVAPGFIETRMTAAIPVAVREVARRLSALGQGGLPHDVAEAITFLAMPWASGVSGETLRVCGGAFVGA